MKKFKNNINITNISNKKKHKEQFNQRKNDFFPCLLQALYQNKLLKPSFKLH